MHRAVAAAGGRLRARSGGAGGPGLLHLLREGRPLRLVLRRRPSRLRRQRGEGHGLGATLGYREVARLFEREVAAQELGGAGGAGERLGALRRGAGGRAQGHGGRRHPARRSHRRGDRAGAPRRAALPARASSTGCRTTKGPAEVVDGIRLTMEGLALTGAWTDPARGLISLIVLEMGGSSRLCALLEPGEEVVLMGPTGTPTEIPTGETVLLAGGGLGNAVLFSIAAALKARRQPRALLRGLQAGQRPLQAHGPSKKAATSWSGAWTRGAAITARRPQDQIDRRQRGPGHGSATAAGGWAR